VCGEIYGNPLVPHEHEYLTAPDGQYFAGLTYVFDTAPYPTGDHVYYRQAIDVRNWGAGADRTNYEFEIWSQIAHSYDWDRGGQAKQQYIIWWNDDGLMPPDLTVEAFDHHFKIGHWDTMAFCKGMTHNFESWRKLTLTGSIPDNPQVVVLEIRLREEWNPSTSHNCFDGVVFSVESATGSSIAPFAGDIPNSDFEEPDFNTVYCGPGHPHPSGWDLLRRFKCDPNGHNGPIEGYTNGVTTPTDPHGITTPSGTHFWGRVDQSPYTGEWDLQGYWGHVIPVRNWSPCATGIRYKLHYLSKMWDSNDSGFQELQLCWDNPEAEHSILDPPANDAEMLQSNWFPWIEVFNLNDRSTPGASEFSGFDDLEQIGEFSPTDLDGNPYAPEYVLLRHNTYVFAGYSHDCPFKWMYDKVDFYVEAIIPTDIRILTDSPLPDGDCEEFYSVQLIGCYVEPLTFSFVSGHLPPGLGLSPGGLISGQPTSPGTFSFIVQLEDGTQATTTKEFEITAGGNCCGEIAADFDGDGDVDHEDFGFLQMCMTGAGGGVPLPPDSPDCSCADLDRDGLDVDQMDLGEFEYCASGPGIAADPGCDDQACCFEDGSCLDMHRTDCTRQGGNAQGLATDCDTTDCPWIGACCLPGGTCQEDMWSDECTAQGGAPRGPGSNCEEPCMEACCYNSNGYCIDLPPADCNPVYATSQGPGTECLPNHVCPNPWPP